MGLPKTLSEGGVEEACLRVGVPPQGYGAPPAGWWVVKTLPHTLAPELMVTQYNHAGEKSSPAMGCDTRALLRCAAQLSRLLFPLRALTIDIFTD